MPDADEMLTIEGALDLASSGMAYFQPRNTPSALTAITRRHSAKVVFSTSPGVPTPALLTRPSSRPWVCAICAIASVQSASRVTSREMSSLPRPARSLRIGIPPAAAMASQVAEPSVPSAPVTSTMWSLSCMTCVLRINTVLGSRCPPDQPALPSRALQDAGVEPHPDRRCPSSPPGPVDGARAAPCTSKSGKSARHSNVLEVAMAALALGEARCAGHAFGLDDAGARCPLALQPLAHRLSPGAIDRSAVRSHARLWETGDLQRHCLGRRPRLAMWDDLLAKADAVAFLGRHLASRHDNLQRLANTHQARQPHGAAIDQRHAPAPTIDAEVGALRHHAHVAPHGELHAARHGWALHRSDHGLRQFQARGP